MSFVADFYKKYPNPGAAREAAVVKEVLKGNVPSWSFQFLQVGNVSVAPDYLAIGNDDEFCRVPLTNYAGQYLATKLGYSLPTPEMVELIYSAAAFKLPPKPTNWYQGDGHLMRLGSNYVVHNNMINFSLKGRAVGIVAGHKKDVVSDVVLLKQHPRHVIIYGWDTSSRHPIQHEQWVHDRDYEDYSHGLRFVIGPATFCGPCSLTPAPQAFLDLVV